VQLQQRPPLWSASSAPHEAQAIAGKLAASVGIVGLRASPSGPVLRRRDESDSTSDRLIGLDADVLGAAWGLGLLLFDNVHYVN
jgi:hypothetical protein